LSERYDLIIHGAIAATPNGIGRADIAIRDGRFAAVGEIEGDAAVKIDARGLHALPGVIDTQVHFREPGMTHKEDLGTGTAAAALGGVTAVFEMPNTNPNTLTSGDIADKCARAKGRAWCDIAFFVGAAVENASELAEVERTPGCAGVKVFMGSSTGSLLVEDDAGVREARRAKTTADIGRGGRKTLVLVVQRQQIRHVRTTRRTAARRGQRGRSGRTSQPRETGTE